jgi:hypothetical protein
MHQLRILVLEQNIVTLVHNGAKTSCGFLPCGSFFSIFCNEFIKIQEYDVNFVRTHFFRLPVDLDFIRLPAVEQNLKSAFGRAPAVTMAALAVAVTVEWILWRSWSRFKKMFGKTDSPHCVRWVRE